MARTVRYSEADGDYIKIGGRIYPASDMTSDDVSDVLSRAQRDYDDEQEKIELAKLRRRGIEILSELPENPTIEDIHRAFVPSEGPAESQAGELVRAMMYLLYRCYNDGDVFYDGYGREIASSSAKFIYENVEPSQSLFKEIVIEELTGQEYCNALEELSGIVLDYIFANEETFAVPRIEDSRIKSKEAEEFFDEFLDDTYEFELDISGDIEDVFIASDLISMEDVYDNLFVPAVEKAGISEGNILKKASDYYVLTDLRSSQYNKIESIWWDEVDNYIEYLEDTFEDELDSEY